MKNHYQAAMVFVLFTLVASIQPARDYGACEGIVYCVIARHLVRKAGHKHATAHTGAVTLIQRFGSALNLNIHYHMLFLDVVYVDSPNGIACFRWVKAPSNQDVRRLRTP
jgi:hypothetical protein